MNGRYTLNDGYMEYAPDEGEWVHYSDYSKMRGEYQAQVHALKSRLESLEKDAELLDWLGTAPAGCIRMDTNPFAPTYINYSASGGDIRPALTKAMQANKGGEMWQPIETAPKEIDLICKWANGAIERAMICDDGEDHDYHVLFDGEQYSTMPIAWMYIPE